MKLIYSLGNQSHTISLERSADQIALELDGIPIQLLDVAIAAPRVTFFYKDKPVTAYVIQSGTKRWVHVNGRTLVLTREDTGKRNSRASGGHQGTGSGMVLAPMPGQVRTVLVQAGERVTQAQPLLILEAMKMELKVLAPHDGTVSKLNVAQGASVEREQILAEIKEQT